jgi:hypothetical protein
LGAARDASVLILISWRLLQALPVSIRRRLSSNAHNPPHLCEILEMLALALILLALVDPGEAFTNRCSLFKPLGVQRGFSSPTSHSHSSSHSSSQIKSVEDLKLESLTLHLQRLLAEVESTKARIATCKKEKNRTASQKKLEAGLQAAEAVVVEKQRRATGLEQERQKLLAKRVRQGGEVFDWELAYSTHMPESMEDVTCVATGEGGYVALYDSGGSSYHGIPTELIKDIGRAKNSKLSIVSIGPKYGNGEKEGESQYYLLTNNGQVFLNDNAYPGFV